MTPSLPPPSGSRAVERAVAVLTSFDDGADELTASSLAARTGLPMSTTHRIAQALVRGGLLERSPVGYRIGPGLVSLAVPPLVRLGIDACAPQLYALAAGVGITASLAIVRGAEAVTVFSARPPDRFCDSQIPRTRQPVGSSATGRVVLAFDPHRTARSRVAGGDLDRIRRRGYAVDAANPSVLAVAVPILDDARRPWGAVGVQAGRARLTEPAIRSIVPAMHHAAAQMSVAARNVRTTAEIHSR